ncbi:MAG TPA: ATP-binding cassette domain-containing protein [Solirubrobacteraceae bacterium]|nr:ATP-binding cassette domain-containing protein [Solirubrobacteraceae bacterium]
MTLLALNDVTKRFQDGAKVVSVLEGVSVEIECGDIVGVYGERRAGKSTLLKVMAGYEPPTEGVVSFVGQDLASLSPGGRARRWRHRGIALVRGDWRPLRSGQPAIEYVAIALTSGGLTLEEAESMARPVLERVGASAWAHLSTDRLSLNERVRVELARALIGEPRLLLVDEPAVLIDPGESRELYTLLRSLARELKMALVIASEDTMAIGGVPRVMTLGDGRLRTTDSRRRVVSLADRRTHGGAPWAS